MATLDDLIPAYRMYMRLYRYRRSPWKQRAIPARPLSSCRVAIVTSAGFYRLNHQPFDATVRGGDWSFRVIPRDTDLTTLQVGQKSDAFDRSGIVADANLALPLDRLREMETAGEIGRVAPRHFSFMGSITAPGRLLNTSGPESARLLREDAVDIALLTPVWPMCHQTVGLLAGLIENEGIATVCISLLPEVMEKVRPPRVLPVDRPLGYPLGEPNRPEVQREILRAALALALDPNPA